MPSHPGGRHRRFSTRGWLVLTKLLRAYLRPHTGQVLLVVLLLSVQAAGGLYLPNLNADIINRGVLDGDTAYIWRTGGLMLGIALALSTVSVIAIYWAARVSMTVGASLRATIYQRVQRFSAREINQFGTASLITRNTNDVQQVQAFLQVALTLLVIALVTSVGGVVMAIREGAALSVLLMVAVPVMALIIAVMLAAVVPLFRSIQSKVDRINQLLREQISGIRVIRAFLRTATEQGRFQLANFELTRTSLRANRIFAVTSPVLVIVLNLSAVGIIWFGGHLVSRGSMPIGNLLAFVTYILQILLAVITAVTVIILIPRAVASAERITQVLSTVPTVADPAQPGRPAHVTGAVEFRNVSFAYPGAAAPVLTGVTFTLWPGQTSAIIGGTGSGKTTLLSLILRFFDPAGGAVLVNGLDVRKQSAEELWSGVGLVPQQAFLFGGTVASNLRFAGPHATDTDLWRALGVAQALDFVASMPGQLDASVDQGGTNLSGGQRQRLSIARALLTHAQLYLFDDCFSALDPATDARLQAALRAETRSATVVIVAQRASTVMRADQIIVLDAGQIAGVGTHRQLLAACEPYREIVTSQLGEGTAA
ncbi:MAG TPA: ABC transporter ATP-binding protein [Streptosporangiaceae bacterium]|jgi:ATP-binding cassette subfamily B protein